MMRVNIHEVKTHLSEYLANLSKDDRILICKRNIPIAEIRPLPQPVSTPRPLGLAKGMFAIPKSFFEPLPDDLISAFENPK